MAPEVTPEMAAQAAAAQAQAAAAQQAAVLGGPGTAQEPAGMSALQRLRTLTMSGGAQQPPAMPPAPGMGLLPSAASTGGAPLRPQPATIGMNAIQRKVGAGWALAAAGRLAAQAGVLRQRCVARWKVGLSSWVLLTLRTPPCPALPVQNVGVSSGDMVTVVQYLPPPSNYQIALLNAQVRAARRW